MFDPKPAEPEPTRKKSKSMEHGKGGLNGFRQIFKIILSLLQNPNTVIPEALLIGNPDSKRLKRLDPR